MSLTELEARGKNINTLETIGDMQHLAKEAAATILDSLYLSPDGLLSANPA